ncbi:hypothetical protein [Kribbella sp. NPDC004875]|uniref:hypothetical protein n=1 Tax=Kribbella sp. NPDC004875 TaxID=3364107 RepID=UPI0036B5DF94
MTDNTPTDAEIVDALLAMNGISPTPEEIEQLVAAYPVSRMGVESLYTMPGVRYAEPAVTFDPRI